MNEIKKNLGKKIKYFREQKGLTQEKLAEMLDFNCRSLSFIKCGTNFVTADTLEKLCKFLEVTPKQLFDFEYNHQKPQDMKKEILVLLEQNNDKLTDVYKIIKGFLD